MHRSASRLLLGRALSLAIVGALAACDTTPATTSDASIVDANGPDATYPYVDREPGVRTPVHADCDPLDDTRCLLPWPSSAFLVADATTTTGVRLDFSIDSIRTDDPMGPWAVADGFSRVTSLVAGFPVELDRTSLGASTSGLGGAMRLFVATPSHPHYGEEIPLRLDLQSNAPRSEESVVYADPLAVLDPATDYVVVVLDDLVAADGSALDRNATTSAVLGLTPPRTETDAALTGYHAPTRALLGDVGIDPAHVLRVWDFTTRSELDVTGPMLAMRDAALEAYEAGDVTFVVDSVSVRSSGSVAAVVRGHMEGLPGFLDDDGVLSRGDDGLPTVTGTTTAPFRVTIPRGEGDYRAVIYGHGAGGSVDDSSFDDELADDGVAKVSIEVDGWTSDELLNTFTAVAEQTFHGSSLAIGPMMQSAVYAVVLDHAVGGALGDLLSAATLGTTENPAVTRRPGLDGTAWVGGSLGGTMGLMITSIDEELHHGVLNVPGAAWSHWMRDSAFFTVFAGAVRRANGGDLNAVLMVAIGQTILDLADGANFADHGLANGDVFLVQESMGDPILPNAGNEMVARSTHAQQVAAVLSPVAGVTATTTASGGASGFTQYQVASTDQLAIHGFAADQGETSGQAAFEQIRHFLTTGWDTGVPETIVPTLCPGGSCDFSD